MTKLKRLAFATLSLTMIMALAACKKDEVVETEPPTGPHLIVDDSTIATDSVTGDTEDAAVDMNTPSAEETTSTDPNDPNHIHNYQEVETTDATCERAGTVLKQCACGSEKSEILPATGHNYQETSATKATCTTAGSSVKVCTNCKDKKTETLVATGHNFQVTSTTKATCSTAGSEVKTCSKCQEKETKTIAKLNHTYQTTTSAATCTAEGKETQKCSICGATGTNKNIPALGHKYKDTVTKESTCTTEGAMNRECTRCGYKTTGKVEKAEHTYKTVETPATCTEKGKKEEVCSVCNNVKTRTTIAATGHKYVETVKTAATCTTAGTKDLKCSACDSAKTEAIAALGHKYVEVDKTPATCTTAGSVTTKCSNCEDVVTTAIDALGHTEVKTEVTPPTCAAEGSGTKSCSVCQEDLGTYSIPKIACDASTITETSDSGYTYFTCSVCSACGQKSNYVFAVSQSDAANEMLSLINSYRASHGLSALSLSNDLCGTARSRAQSIANSFSAESGENIANNVTSIAAMFDKWISSDSACANILREDITTFGFGYHTTGTANLYGVARFN